jgi:O-antigen/teichoic acid export membrane protein
LIRTLIRNAVTYSGATFIRLAIGFFLTPILIHSLGASGYGVWSFVSVFSINGYLTLLSLGLQATLIRDLAAADARADWTGFSRDFFATLGAYVFAGVVGFLALLLVSAGLIDHAFNIPGELLPAAHTLVVLLAVQTLIDFPALAVDGVIVARQRYALRTALESGRFALFAIGAAAVAQSGAGPVGLGWVSLATAVVGAIASAIAITVTMRGRLRPAMPSPADLLHKVRASTELFAIRLNSVVFGQMDRTILATVVNTTVITHYDIAARINGFAMLAQTLPASVILPAASARSALGASGDLQRIFLTFTRYTVMISSLVVFGLFVLAEPLIRYWIGPEYVADTGIARLFLVPPMAFMFVHVGWNMMVAIGRIRSLLYVQFTTNALNLVASVGFTLVFGVPGVILGTILGNSLAAVLYLRLYLSALRIPGAAFLRDVVVRPTLAALAATLLLWATTVVRPPENLIELGIYFGGFLTVGGLVSVLVAASASERSVVRASVARLLPRSAS